VSSLANVIERHAFVTVVYRLCASSFATPSALVALASRSTSSHLLWKSARCLKYWKTRCATSAFLWKRRKHRKCSFHASLTQPPLSYCYTLLQVRKSKENILGQGRGAQRRRGDLHAACHHGHQVSAQSSRHSQLRNSRMCLLLSQDVLPVRQVPELPPDTMSTTTEDGTTTIKTASVTTAPRPA